MRNLLAAVATAIAAALAFACPAAAVVVDCAGLQAALAGATDGTTVTLAAGQFCPGEYQPAEVDITIEGELAGGVPAAGFEPAGATDERSLFVDSHGATTTIRNLIFRGGDVGDGGLFVIGDAGTLNLSGLVFEDVRQAGSGGGLLVTLDGDVTLADSTFIANDAGMSGGGARIDARTASITGSSFAGNAAGQHGGGLALTTEAHRDVVTRAVPADRDGILLGNTFSGNIAGAPATRVPAAPTENSGRGGGLFLGKSGDSIDNGSPGDADGVPPVIEVSGGVFEFNEVAAGRRVRSGGGAEISGVASILDSVRVVSNVVRGDQESDVILGGTGGGVALDGLNRGASLFLRNSAVAANEVGAGGSGGGLFMRCGDCGASMRLVHATVAGNRTGSGGSGSGIAGGGFDSLEVVNSIVFGNTVPGFDDTDIEGLEDVTVVNSDVCRFAGSDGNVCADPKLADPAGTGDVHQTATSPTIDAAPAPSGNDGVGDDLDGDARPTLVSGRAGTPYDMGADEWVQADSAITLTAEPDPVKSGEPYTLKATVTNGGPSPARAVRVVFGLGGATLVSATPGQGSCSGNVTCDLGEIPAGGSATVTLVLKAFAPQGRRADVTVTHTATVSSATPDPALANNSASRAVTVQGGAGPVVTPPPASGEAPAVTTRRCGSRRFFRIRVRKRRDPVVSAVIRVDGKRVAVRRRRGRLVASVDLLFKPRRRIVVTIRAVTRSGRRLSGRRVYHPCVPKRPGGVPEL